MNTLKELYQDARHQLELLYTKPEIEHLVFLLLHHLKGVSKTDLVREPPVFTSDEGRQLMKFIDELKALKPIQYILGYGWFCGMKFLVNENTLIPRPETEELTELVHSTTKLQPPASILDIGTGSGCIAIALKRKIPSATVHGMDVSAMALDMAKKNATLNAADVTFFEGDIISDKFHFQFKEKYDCLVSNPPYVRYLDRPSMQERVIRHEPHLAIFVDHPDPLLFYRKIADFARTHLLDNGWLYFEINGLFGNEMKSLLIEKGFRNTEVIKDMSGNYRFCRCQL